MYDVITFFESLSLLQKCARVASDTCVSVSYHDVWPVMKEGEKEED